MEYSANLILVIGIVAIYYLTMVLFGYNIYGGPLLKTLLYSFGFAVLYVLALGSIVTFLNSFQYKIVSDLSYVIFIIKIMVPSTVNVLT